MYPTKLIYIHIHVYVYVSIYLCYSCFHVCLSHCQLIQEKLPGILQVSSLPPADSPRSDTDGQRLRKSLSSHVTRMGAPGPDLGFTWAVEKKQGSNEQH